MGSGFSTCGDICTDNNVHTLVNVPSVDDAVSEEQSEGRKMYSADPVEVRSMTRLYDIGESLSMVGRSKVYGGSRKSDGTAVAIKKLYREKVIAWGEMNGKTLPLEICLLAKLAHIHGVIKMLDHFEDVESFIVVMEKPDQVVNMADYVKKNGPLDEEATRRFFRQILTVVITTMAAGVVHRNITAKNILVEEDYNIKLINFGSGAFLKNYIFDTLPCDSIYQPPEWIQNKKCHARSLTVWMLGLLLYFMLHGSLPFDEPDSILYSLPSLGSQLSPELKSLIHRCLAKSTLERIKLEQIPKHHWINIGYDKQLRANEMTKHFSRVSFNEHVEMS